MLVHLHRKINGVLLAHLHSYCSFASVYNNRIFLLFCPQYPFTTRILKGIRKAIQWFTCGIVGLEGCSCYIQPQTPLRPTMFVSVISVCSILLTFAPHVVQAQSGLGYDLLPSSKLWTILVSSWIMSFLSLFGSMSVMYLILRKRRWRESGAFSHIMVG